VPTPGGWLLPGPVSGTVGRCPAGTCPHRSLPIAPSLPNCLEWHLQCLEEILSSSPHQLTGLIKLSNWIFRYANAAAGLSRPTQTQPVYMYIHVHVSKKMYFYFFPPNRDSGKTAASKQLRSAKAPAAPSLRPRCHSQASGTSQPWESGEEETLLGARPELAARQPCPAAQRAPLRGPSPPRQLPGPSKPYELPLEQGWSPASPGRPGQSGCLAVEPDAPGCAYSPARGAEHLAPLRLTHRVPPASKRKKGQEQDLSQSLTNIGENNFKLRIGARGSRRASAERRRALPQNRCRAPACFAASGGEKTRKV